MERGASVVLSGLIVVMTTTVSACTHPAAAPVSATAKPVHSAERQARVPGEYLVTLRPGEVEGAISEHYGRFGIKTLSALGDDTFLLILSDDPGPQQMEDLVLDDSRIKAIQPNIIYWANRPGNSGK